ncbi:polysaccharide deacetylase [Nitratiruptor sp. YY08-26]|uniref:polysaccharide deacetylase family protein n=1 Tax=unclassified Nitratiruptor TaxID=2624044 RepID=UPI0019163C21|nr:MULTISPECIES: polysaccharide deacetylase family protein [unclassified Nitratiruptor]BCD63139.1 polysaccharide deacetylase [Nitratiruptor sp. YY08-13]BCD67074.1 polysaccharide deacetylase [Nitratiruptor sp. YY08-26]
MFHKLLLRSSLFFALSLFGDAHIFVYHRFGDPRYPATNTSLEQLKKDFTYLKEHHYKVIPLQQLVDALKNREKIDDKWIVLTIDDGYKSFLKALPLFRKFKYPFTIFIATKPIENGYGDFLHWEDLRLIKRFGEIGLHSHAHPHLVNLSNEQIQKDTQQGLQLLQKHLALQPKSYAYPYGEYDERVKKIIKSFGFSTICNQNIGAISKTSDVYDLDRIALVGKSNIAKQLHIQHLNAQWLAPIHYPRTGILENVKIKVSPQYTTGWLYVTDYGWKRVKIKNGIVNEYLGYKLKRDRVRVIIKVKHSKINTKILVRSRYGTE